MNVELIAHTQLSDDFVSSIGDFTYTEYLHDYITSGQCVAFTAIRTCYSPNRPTEILEKEGERYFGRTATDGKGGTDADRLIRMIVSSGHTSTLEHLSFTFAIEGISRACLAQLTRHRVGFSFSVQSQRYVKLGSNDKSGGFDYVVPEKIDNTEVPGTNRYEGIMAEYRKSPMTAQEIYEIFMDTVQETYDLLRKAGVPAEDARMVLPQATTTNLILTANLRALLDFYEKRKKGNGAQAEIAELAERMKDEVVKVEGWIKPFFK